MALILASHSPRRREVMHLVSPVFEVDEAAFDEGGVAAETPLALVLALARGKAQEVFLRRPGDVVVGCDTVVDVDGAVLGKPRDEENVRWMLRLLEGRRHLVHTGVAVMTPGENAPAAAFTETTAVFFGEIPAREIDRYVKTQEPYDKAGGYGVQGWASRYIRRIEGCGYNILGLPVAALYAQLRRLGVLAGA